MLINTFEKVVEMNKLGEKAQFCLDKIILAPAAQQTESMCAHVFFLLDLIITILSSVNSGFPRILSVEVLQIRTFL